ncbi:hypothetical protein LEP1GSC026_1957 [Leptospira interrogans str. 2002000623]|nr:hypothetical protein LEP1GSC026_1957 [Leptospira interrogans str. 2002000623]
MQKVCFSDKENLPHPKIGKTQHNAFLKLNASLRSAGRVGKLNTTLSYGSRWKTQHNAFLWVALENSTQRFPMGRVGKLNTTLSYGSRCGAGTKFYRGFVVTPTDLY